MLQGSFSDLFVVKGTAIGHEIVSVRLAERPEPEVEDMADKIVLTVAEAMSLDPPSPVLVLIGASVQYNLKVIRENVPQGSSFDIAQLFKLRKEKSSPYLMQRLLVVSCFLFYFGVQW